MTTTHLWALIQEWQDSQEFRVSASQLAGKIGVTRSAMSQWKSGQAKPTPTNLRELARVTGVKYALLLDAVVHDMGYLEREADGERELGSAPKTDAPGTGADEHDDNTPVEDSMSEPHGYVLAARDVDDDEESEAQQEYP